MANITMTSLDPVLKTLYKGTGVEDATYQDHPFMAMVAKFEGFVGRNMPLPIKYANGQGRSADFPTAQSNAGSPSFEDFLLTRVSDYAVCGIDGEAIRASASDKGAFIRGLKAKMDSAFGACAASLSASLFLDGTGAIGRGDGAWNVATTDAVLATTSDVVHFEVGQHVVLSDAKTNAVRAGSVTLAGIARDTGTLTASAAWTGGIAAAVNTDYMFVEGDAHNAVSYKKISGLDAWIPASAPGATLFFGVNRSTDTRLGGQRLDASGYATVEEALIDGASIVAAEGGRPDVCLVNPVKFRKLVKELGAKVQYDKLQAQNAKGAMAHIGFRSVIVDGDRGPVQVVSDRDCPEATAHMIQLDTWKLCSLGPAPGILMDDGNRILRQAAADGYEVRVGYYAQLGCSNPSANCNITLP